MELVCTVRLKLDMFFIVLQILIGCVWLFHGFYSKLLNGIPRHHLIVRKILGASHSGVFTKVIGLLEVSFGIWAFTGWQPVGCATFQTLAIITMNTLEITLARELLISAIGMVILNLIFLTLIWFWALSIPSP